MTLIAEWYIKVLLQSEMAVVWLMPFCLFADFFFRLFAANLQAITFWIRRQPASAGSLTIPPCTVPHWSSSDCCGSESASEWVRVPHRSVRVVNLVMVARRWFDHPHSCHVLKRAGRASESTLQFLIATPTTFSLPGQRLRRTSVIISSLLTQSLQHAVAIVVPAFLCLPTDAELRR